MQKILLRLAAERKNERSQFTVLIEVGSLTILHTNRLIYYLELFLFFTVYFYASLYTWRFGEEKTSQQNIDERDVISNS